MRRRRRPSRLSPGRHGRPGPSPPGARCGHLGLVMVALVRRPWLTRGRTARRAEGRTEDRPDLSRIWVWSRLLGRRPHAVLLAAAVVDPGLYNPRYLAFTAAVRPRAGGRGRLLHRARPARGRGGWSSSSPWCAGLRLAADGLRQELQRLVRGCGLPRAHVARRRGRLLRPGLPGPGPAGRPDAAADRRRLPRGAVGRSSTSRCGRPPSRTTRSPAPPTSSPTHRGWPASTSSGWSPAARSTPRPTAGPSPTPGSSRARRSWTGPLTDVREFRPVGAVTQPSTGRRRRPAGGAGQRSGQRSTRPGAAAERCWPSWPASRWPSRCP